ncbi:hypothetical protein ACFQFC_34970 [Amorphoplanes digitatis]|uniref:Uncharacterized protein n=1 Tax=Actinoplanes digitatis TaxID=1868 RepID=A0A7W7HV58_9ACTN|nr:hypothetical protein [Actinoplanes digitatis]MBB4761367.1 hypothetical protein [Actinoplanes digitatis]BFE69778.1 hypothetical protein GCM10020092_030790 [Actinoplanes digitatis]GID94587.1 hypothetical protein Adi01nite_39990 [Actinoplanes digitatis]
MTYPNQQPPASPRPAPPPGGFRPAPPPGGFRPGPPQQPAPAYEPDEARTADGDDTAQGEERLPVAARPAGGEQGTGHPAVDAVLRSLANAAALAPGDQIAEYEAAHQVLQETLASIDR